MTNHDKSGGTTKKSKADSKTPGTSAADRASGEKSKSKGKQPSLLHIDRDLRFRRHMIPKRPPMFGMDGPNRMMAPHPRDTGRNRISMLRERRPSMMPSRNMFKDSGARMGPPPPGGLMGLMQGPPKEPGMMPPRNMFKDSGARMGPPPPGGFMAPMQGPPKEASGMPPRNRFKDSGARMGPPPPGGFMAPMQGPPKESKDIQRDFIKPPVQGERRVPGGIPQRKDHMSNYPMGFPGRTMDYQGKRVEPFRKGPYPTSSQQKQEGFPHYPDRQLRLHDLGMKKNYIQQGIDRFPHVPGQYMMGMPPSNRKMIRFPEKFMDMSNYSMDFHGRFMDQQGKYVNPLNRAPTHQGRPIMPVPPPMRQRFMQRPERYIDMSRYTMDFEGRYRDNYGRQIDPMEQFNAKVGRYIRSQPTQNRRMARFPERYMDLSRYSMDFQGRFIDTHGRHVDPLRRFHRKAPVSLPLNQRRFIRQPEKYMDMSGYTMDFQGRFRDRRGKPIDLLGRHLSHPGRFVLPGPGIQRDVPTIPRRFIAPPLKQMDLSRYSMDFEGRLMDNHGRYVDQMRRSNAPTMQMVPRRFVAPPLKQMDLSRYSMDFEGRLMDNHGRYVDQMRHLNEPTMPVIARRFGAPPVKQRDMPRYPMDLPERLMGTRSHAAEQMGRPSGHMMQSIPRFTVPPPKHMDMSRYTMDFEGRLMDNQGRYVDQMGRSREQMMPMIPRFALQPSKQMDMPRYPMDFEDRQMEDQGPHADQMGHSREQMMPMGPRFSVPPSKQMDMPRYPMDFERRQMDDQGPHADQMGRSREQMMPMGPRFALQPPKHMDMPRYTIDFEDRQVDDQGSHADQMGRSREQMMPMIPRYAGPPPHQMDMSRYTMDFEGRLMDNQGRYVDQMGRSSMSMMPMGPRFALQPPKQMDMPTRYTMDFEDRQMGDQGPHADQMGGFREQMMPVFPGYAAPPPHLIDMSRYTMDFEGRLMDNQGRPVVPMRHFDEHMMPPPEYNQGNFMDIPRHPMDMQDRSERPSSPEHRPTPVIEKGPPMEPEPTIPEKDYSEPKSRSELRRSRSPGELRVEFQDTPREENDSPTPSEEEAFMLMEDERVQTQFMKFQMSPSMYAAMRSSMLSMPDECFQMPPQMMHFNYEMFMQQPSADDMMMTEMMNAGYPLYQSMRASFGTTDSDYMMNEQQWFLNDCPECMGNEMSYRHDPMTPGMQRRFSLGMGNEPIQQGHLPALMEYGVDEPCHGEQRFSQFADRRSHSMGDQEFDIHPTRFSHYEDYPAIMQDGYQTPTNEMFSRGDHDNYMFDGGYYPDYHMGDYYSEGFMSGSPMGFMNDFQQPFCFDPEYIGMNPGFSDEYGSPYPYPFMGGENFGIGYYDTDEDEDCGQRRDDDDEEEEEEEEMRHHMRKHCQRGRTPSPMRGPPHHHRRSPSPRRGEGDIEAEAQRGVTRPRSFFGDEDQLFDDKHARYLEEAAECLRERSRFLREQHERFVQELENSGPINHHQIQAEAEAHAQMVEEEVNSTEAEAKAVERLARTARGVSNADDQCALFDNGPQFVDSQSRYQHKHMDMH